MYFDRIYRLPEERRGFLNAHLLQVPQDEYRSLHLRKLSGQSPDRRGQLVGFQIGGTISPSCRLRVRFQRHKNQPPAPAGFCLVLAQADDDLIEPRGEWSSHVNPVQMTPHPDESFLRSIPCFIRIPQKPVRESKYPSLMRFHQETERIFISLLTSYEQIVISGIHSTAPWWLLMMIRRNSAAVKWEV
jgi:hypothetical protein